MGCSACGCVTDIGAYQLDLWCRWWHPTRRAPAPGCEYTQNWAMEPPTMNAFDEHEEVLRGQGFKLP